LHSKSVRKLHKANREITTPLKTLKRTLRAGESASEYIELENSGTFPWPETCVLKFSSGDNFLSCKELPLKVGVQPTGKAKVLLMFEAPQVKQDCQLEARLTLYKRQG